MKWYLDVLKKYAVFSGRARRREYWYFVLFNVIISVLSVFLDKALGTFNSDLGIGIIGGVYSLGVLLPGIGVAVRRLHDTNRSGWWLLIGLIPLVGAVVLIVFALMDSQPGSNRFGPNPKELTA
ncbi:MAG: DUF805 domain-containing protein [Verrucomicrobiales bacterium]